MSNKAAKYLFIFGSLFCFVVLIILTFDTMGRLDERAPVITEEVNAGKKVWHKYDCIGCHTILGNGSYFAPDMTKVTKRKPKEYLKKFILNPRVIKKDAAMPLLGLSEKEANDLMAFLDWMSEVDTNGWPPAPVLAASLVGRSATMGQLFYQQEDCAACHQVSGVGGTAGPDLTFIGRTQQDIGWHIQHLKDPESMIPGSAMPAFDHLSDDELRELAEFLLTLK
jgi:nitric oxide reductase subunit C